jgi:hypothetical protein
MLLFCTLIATWNFGTGAPYFEIFGTAPACCAAAKVFEILVIGHFNYFWNFRVFSG